MIDPQDWAKTTDIVREVKFLRSRTLHYLTKYINAALAEGATLHGTPFTYQGGSNELGEPYQWFAQAVIYERTVTYRDLTKDMGEEDDQQT